MRDSVRWSVSIKCAVYILAFIFVGGCRDTPSGPPHGSTLVIVSGDNQTVTWGEVTTQRLGVRVLDQSDAGVKGVPITWTIALGGGSLDSSVIITDESGTAYVRYAANTEFGVSTVKVTAATPSLAAVSFALDIPPEVITGHSSFDCTPPNGESRPLEVVLIKNEYLFNKVTGYDAGGSIVAFDPPCSDFTDNASSPHFSFAEFNRNGYHPWAVVMDRLISGAEATRAAYGGPLAVSSGYRCPDKQHDVDPNHWFSGGRHMHGDAIDFVTTSMEHWLAVSAAAKASGACVEPVAASSTDHVHADWRGTCPNGW